MLSWEEEKKLLSLAPSCSRSLGQLVLHHLPLIKKWAFLLAREAHEREDLVSEGVIAFIEAIKNFQSVHSVRLASYAKKWIIFAMRRFMEKNTPWVDISDMDVQDMRAHEGMWVDEVYQEAQAILVKEALTILSAQERALLSHRILTENKVALKDIASERGCSLERIRQIESDILRKVKKRLVILQHR